MSGGQDPMFTEDMGQELAGHFPQGQHLHFEQMGHLMIAEAPSAINSAIAQFLNGLE